MAVCKEPTDQNGLAGGVASAGSRAWPGTSRKEPRDRDRAARGLPEAQRGDATQLAGTLTAEILQAKGRCRNGRQRVVSALVADCCIDPAIHNSVRLDVGIAWAVVPLGEAKRQRHPNARGACSDSHSEAEQAPARAAARAAPPLSISRQTLRRTAAPAPGTRATLGARASRTPWKQPPDTDARFRRQGAASPTAINGRARRTGRAAQSCFAVATSMPPAPSRDLLSAASREVGPIGAATGAAGRGRGEYRGTSDLSRNTSQCIRAGLLISAAGTVSPCPPPRKSRAGWTDVQLLWRSARLLAPQVATRREAEHFHLGPGFVSAGDSPPTFQISGGTCGEIGISRTVGRSLAQAVAAACLIASRSSRRAASQP